MEADWPHLPADLLTTIAEKASTTNTEYVHIRAVCKPWRRALTPNPRHLPHQVPWLLLPLAVHRRVDTSLSFYDLDRRKIHQFKLPFARKKHLCGSSHGWLILEHYCGVSLFNPVSRRSLHLPSFDALLTSWGVAMGNTESSYHPSGVDIDKAILSCNPSEPGCCVVARFYYVVKRLSAGISLGRALAFCRIGGTDWTTLTVPTVENTTRMMDFTCQNNSVYAINNKIEVTIYDLQSLSVRTFPSNLDVSNFGRTYLVEGDGGSGGPLLVNLTDDSGQIMTSVYKWFNDGQPQWRQMRDIGNRVLFLHHVNTRNTVSSANLKLEKWQGNQICYDMKLPPTGPGHIGIYLVNMESRGDFENFASSIGVFPEDDWLTLWFSPSLI